MPAKKQNELFNLRTLSYDEYIHKMEKKIEVAEKRVKDIDKIDLIKLNHQRYERLSKIYKVSDDLKSLLKSLKTPQTWFVFVEYWCRDSNQVLPALSKMAQTAPEIQLKLIPRDKNTEIMEQYLTNGKKSIPKLLAVDESGNELFQWGPRPEPAQKVFEEHLDEDPSKQKSKQAVDTWYARDLCRTFELEMAEKLKEIGS